MLAIAISVSIYSHHNFVGHFGLRLQCLRDENVVFETSDAKVCKAWLSFLKNHLGFSGLPEKQEFEENSNYIQADELDIEDTHL